jgi:hypothetical protein
MKARSAIGGRDKSGRKGFKHEAGYFATEQQAIDYEKQLT